MNILAKIFSSESINQLIFLISDCLRKSLQAELCERLCLAVKDFQCKPVPAASLRDHPIDVRLKVYIINIHCKMNCKIKFISITQSKIVAATLWRPLQASLKAAVCGSSSREKPDAFGAENLPL